jgi:hypothetical protein
VHIHLINQHGRIEPPLEVDVAQPPRMIPDPQNPSREIYLQWDGGVDDEGHLRQCPVCQSRELYARKELPQLTAFVLILLAAAVAVGFYASDHLGASIAVLLAVTAVDLLIFFFAGRRLVCYQCHTQYSRIPIARNQKSWDAPTAERYRLRAMEKPALRVEAPTVDTAEPREPAVAPPPSGGHGD